MTTHLLGSCLCGGVRFEVSGPFLRAGHCHCSRCRKHSGTFGGTQGRVRREHFRLVTGSELVRVYRPDGGAAKTFCSRCGSSLFGGTWPDGDEVSIRLGALDGDPGIRPQCHTFVDSRAPWDEVRDELPQFAGALPPGFVPSTPLVENGIRFAQAEVEPKAKLEALAELLRSCEFGARFRDLAQLRALVARATRTVVATEDDDTQRDGAPRIVGFGRAITDGVSNGYLSMLAVAPDRRRRGIGRAIVRELTHEDRGVTWVLRAGRDSAAFWRSVGFAQSGIAMERLREA